MPPDRILVRAPNWVGDLVMATGAFARIRAAYPAAEIVGAMRPHLRSLLDGTEFFDDFLDAPKAGSPAGLFAQVRAVRRRRFDLAIVLPNSLETGLVPFLARVPRRAGYTQGRPGLMNLGLRAPRARGLLSRRGPRRTPVPMPQYYGALLDRLGLPAGGPETVLAVTPQEREACAAWFAARGVGPDQPVVALNAGASYGASKLWDPARFAAVARHFRERHGMAAVFLSGPAEVEVNRAIAADAGALAAIDPVLPVHMLKPMIQRAALLITTDSGPRHVGVALGVPVVCVIGPTDPRYTNYALDRTALIAKDLDCMPCQRKICPLGHRNCMMKIEIDEVVRAGEELVARLAGGQQAVSRADGSGG